MILSRLAGANRSGSNLFIRKVIVISIVNDYEEVIVISIVNQLSMFMKKEKGPPRVCPKGRVMVQTPDCSKNSGALMIVFFALIIVWGKLAAIIPMSSSSSSS